MPGESVLEILADDAVDRNSFTLLKHPASSTVSLVLAGAEAWPPRGLTGEYRGFDGSAVVVIATGLFDCRRRNEPMVRRRGSVNDQAARGPSMSKIHRAVHANDVRRVRTLNQKRFTGVNKTYMCVSAGFVLILRVFCCIILS